MKILRQNKINVLYFHFKAYEYTWHWYTAYTPIIHPRGRGVMSDESHLNCLLHDKRDLVFLSNSLMGPCSDMLSVIVLNVSTRVSHVDRCICLFISVVCVFTVKMHNHGSQTQAVGLYIRRTRCKNVPVNGRIYFYACSTSAVSKDYFQHCRWNNYNSK